MFNNNAVKQKFSVYKVHSLEVVHQHWYTVWAYGCGWTSSINWNALPTGWSTQLTTRSLSRFECKTSGTMVGVWRLVWGFTCCPVWQTKFNRTTELKSVWPTQHQWAQQSLTCTTNFSHYYAWLLKAAAYLYRHNSVCVCVCVCVWWGRGVTCLHTCSIFPWELHNQLRAQHEHYDTRLHSLNLYF